MDVYVNGLRRTLFKLPPPKKLLYISSTGVYGETGGAWVDESTPPAPIDEAGHACLEAEGVLQELAEKRGFPWTILRLAGIYGPGRMIGAQTLQAGLPIQGDPDTHINLIHVDDVVRVVVQAEQIRAVNRIYNVSDGAPVVRRDFYECAAAFLNAPAPQFDASAARRRRGDRLIRSDRMRSELGVELKFKDYREGLASCLEGMGS
jgi:nucleoside-diphosphate-sugar epimerase